MNIKDVAAGIIQKEGLILIARRGPKEKLAGFWEFPGGKREQNETIEQCLIRELKEELDIEVVTNGILGESDYHYSGGAIKLIGVYAQIVSGDIKMTVHDSFEWVSPKDLLSYQLAPADIPLAKMLIQK